MHIHILGICGTFMAGIAALAREAGYRVTGSDAGAWPPMSTQLEALGIEVMQGYSAEHLEPAPDMVVVGNVISRGNPAIEHVLDRGLPYVSGPQWLAEHLLRDRWVLAVAGTHGKTTTSSMLAWILEDAKLDPGFLIGGLPGNFPVSARMGSAPFFVIEADEYDTAFFDKRSKFVHYRPRTAILNNLEFDHADIFEDLSAIERQFHHLVRTIPASGQIIAPAQDAALQRVLQQGCWSQTQFTGAADGWQVLALAADWSAFRIVHAGETVAEVHWSVRGEHNAHNALMACLAARHAGVTPAISAEALGRFEGVARRLDLKGEIDGIRIYDDFAHHPTAIEKTIAAIPPAARSGRLIVALEPRSNSMRAGAHAAALGPSLAGADSIHVLARPELPWDTARLHEVLGDKLRTHADVSSLSAALCQDARPGDVIVLMSNGSFDGLPASLPTALKKARHA
ncbi:UDP-N-acetylmuramate-alanine ligase [Oceanococcus atlanticus]|uniref:UDP-N-acetylmuramate--L-alanyl-gamma-D-glutamyl-meso-2,6-diaminoheptandioate ligase n=1 Tax=Oceanococcus atlanticus TaxID=1317117 RepID=A0A1Y1SHQ4_9GAMM|nr:UDP-N-acetylmuramate:L-alanyl-gamma-D-glutamyl-meso-diaminopimelate ligase [Oceanococcus atlanticus]ORE89177.1 UDP-N-acetylmuramate-alanine ligase [Oceanococcus atlanticus]RZO85144.1 MAG: UDP-N-acetylmuramate:L-alanyl-gamma-D-glutamyl-meso-diaminopimelate ligase [Oceanococcus sp.]